MSSVFRIVNNPNPNLIPKSSTKSNLKSDNKYVNTLPKDKPNPFVFNTQKKSSSSNKKSVSNSKIILESEQVIQNPNEKVIESLVNNSIPDNQENIVNKPDVILDKLDVNPNKEKIIKKKYWEYGNCGIKIKDFDKKMGRNLLILEHIDKIFVEFSNYPANSLGFLFNSGEPVEYILGKNKINVLVNQNDSQVNITINEEKVSGVYQVLAVGFTEIFNVKINENDLNKKKVPSFDSFISRLDNIKEIYKIINILTLENKFEVFEINSIDDFNFKHIIDNFLEIQEEFKKNSTEKKMLKSDSNSAFYIKIYETSGIAFIIDNTNNLIFYITENENLSDGSIFIRYYLLNISEKHKIKSIKE
jgi:hypothetical protein